MKLQRLRLSELVVVDDVLGASDLARLLPREALPDILDVATLRRYEANTVVFREGDEGSTLFFVLRGEALLTRENAQVASCARGDCFGEAELLRRGPRSLTAHAASDLEVAELDRGPFTALGEGARAFGLRLLEIAQARRGAATELDAFLKRW